MNTLKKILIVDDEFIIRQGIKHLLNWENNGYKIIGEASNGVEALGIMKTEKPDIIITDIVMPLMDGIELTKQVKAINSEIKILVLSGYSDFEYVKNSFQNGVADYFLKPALNPADLLATLNKIIVNPSSTVSQTSTTFDVENAITKYILGFSEEINTTEITSEFTSPCFRILGINKKTCNRNVTLIDSFMNNGVFEMLGVYNPYKLDINADMRTVLFNYQTIDDSILSATLQTAINTFFENQSSLFFVLSEPFYNIEDIKDVYNNHLYGLTKRKFYYKDISFISANNLKDYSNTIPFNMEEFKLNLVKEKFEKALVLLDNYVDLCLKIHHCDEITLKSLVQNIIYLFVQELESLSTPMPELTTVKMTYLSDINDCEYSQDLRECYIDISKQLHTIIENYNTEISGDVMNKIIKYMKENYDKPINLDQIAKQFDFSYYYLSSYFSARCEEGFNEFLNKIRIDKSIALLKDKTIPIAKISSRVGYSDHSYYCKVFKKFMGTTPSKYRRKLN